MAFKFYISVVRGFKIKVIKIWGRFPPFVEVTGKNLVEGFLSFLSLIGLKGLCQFEYCLYLNIFKKLFYRKLWIFFRNKVSNLFSKLKITKKLHEFGNALYVSTYNQHKQLAHIISTQFYKKEFNCYFNTSLIITTLMLCLNNSTAKAFLKRKKISFHGMLGIGKILLK